MNDVARLFTRTCVNICLKLASHRPINIAVLCCMLCILFMEQKFLSIVDRDILSNLMHGPGERQRTHQ
ncbi:hypothetical protein BAE44_0021241 [Dichanthelium oligosanthes]|uniref:Uncharacterized protein n=1 Tax=Dichanthelium oligosanthes TaxID=888268 RepID=A0A1E5UY54_9POAL|nr:hypothetical protein BAE44_0021241 [Dichanthelium oligosanthes]